MSSNLLSPHDHMVQMAERAKEKRLALNLTQVSLSTRSGVALGVIKKFEQTGKISIESLLKIALVLNSLTEFSLLFAEASPESYISLDQLLKQKPRKRGRK